MPDESPILNSTDAFEVADRAVRENQRKRGHVFPDGAGDAKCAASAIATAQHAVTLFWIRDRLQAGEHLEDLLPV